jgi:hypothetical protein
MFCGAEMRLIRVEPDGSMEIAVYAHHTFKCPDCGEVERRLTFGTGVSARAVDQMAAGNAPSAASTCAHPTGLSVSLDACVEGRPQSQENALEEQGSCARDAEQAEPVNSQREGMVPPTGVLVSASDATITRADSVRLVYHAQQERTSTSFRGRVLAKLRRRLTRFISRHDT